MRSNLLLEGCGFFKEKWVVWGEDMMVGVNNTMERSANSLSSRAITVQTLPLMEKRLEIKLARGTPQGSPSSFKGYREG